MSELRTLKNFKGRYAFYNSETEDSLFNEIKKEAIKWLKELPHLITKEDWFKFFNNTEDDLKSPEGEE